MATVKGKVEITAEFLHTLGAPWDVSVKAAESYKRSFTAGTGATEVDGYGMFQASPGASSTTEINLDALTDINGNTVILTEVRGILLWAPTTNTDSVHLKQGTTAPWTTGFLLGTAPELPIDIGGALCAVCPVDGEWTVTGGSSDIGLTNQIGSAANTINGLVWGVLS